MSWFEIGDELEKEADGKLKTIGNENKHRATEWFKGYNRLDLQVTKLKVHTYISTFDFSTIGSTFHPEGQIVSINESNEYQEQHSIKGVVALSDLDTNMFYINELKYYDPNTGEDSSDKCWIVNGAFNEVLIRIYGVDELDTKNPGLAQFCVDETSVRGENKTLTIQLTTSVEKIKLLISKIELGHNPVLEISAYISSYSEKYDDNLSRVRNNVLLDFPSNAFLYHATLKQNINDSSSLDAKNQEELLNEVNQVNQKLNNLSLSNIIAGIQQEVTSLANKILIVLWGLVALAFINLFL